MMDAQDNTPALGGLSLELEQAIEQFEQGWLEGQSPRIEDYLPAHENRLPLIVELVIAEMEFRLKAKEDPDPSEYLSRFPELSESTASLIHIAKQEFRIRRRIQGPLDAGQFAARYGALAPQLLAELAAERSESVDHRMPEQNGTSKEGRAELGARLSDLEWLAKGGMGEVWIAQDATLHRQVAMKVIQPKYERNAEALQRFMAEAEITSRLEHPGVAPVYGLGEHADGRPCYAMRFVRGESMGEAVRRFFERDDKADNSKGRPETKQGQGANQRGRTAKRTRLDLQVANRSLVFRGLLQRLLAICHTTAYAHERGILHRDLKPENIRLGEHGETILLDWGLAKSLDGEGEGPRQSRNRGKDNGEADDDPAKTKVGSLYGTPQFMSPEQARGDVSKLTHSVDIYGLGTTLYYILTGKAPFPRDSPSKVVDRVIQGDFRPPRSLCRDVPPALEAICLKAMKVDPAARYATATEFAEDLERYLADQPVSVHQDGLTTQARRWLMRHRTLAAIGATSLIAAALVLGVWTVITEQYSRDLASKNQQLASAKGRVDEALSRQTELARELARKNAQLERASAAANQAAKDAREQRDAANLRSTQVIGLANSLVEMVGAAGPGGMRSPLESTGLPHSPSQISAPEYLDRVIKEVDEKFAADDATRGEVLAAVGQTKRSMGLFEAAVPVLTEALRIRRLHAGAEDSAAAGIEFNLAWSLLEIQGRAKEAELGFRNVIRIRQTQEPRDEVALGLAQAGMLWSLYVQGKSQAELLAALGAELGAEGLLNSISIAKVFLDLRAADHARATRNWAEGDRLFKEASDVIDKLVPPDHPFLAARDFTVAGYLRDRGDMRAAQDYVLRGLKIYRERVGIHTYMCDPLYHIARYREYVGDFDEAEALHREAYWLATLNPHTMRSFRYLTLQGMCDFLNKVGKHDELRQLIQSELSGPNAVTGIDAQDLEARRIGSWMETGEFGPVIDALSGNPPDNPRLPNPKSVLCRALFENGRFAEANEIMPIAQHLTEENYLPRAAPSFQVQLHRLARGDARSLADVQAAVPTAPMDRDRFGTVQLLRSLAFKQMEQREFAAAGDSLREAAEIAHRRMSTVDRAFVDLVYDEAILKLAAGDMPAAKVAQQRALEAARARYPKGTITLSDFLHQSGMLALYAGDLRTAQHCLDESISIRVKRWRGVNPRVWSPVLDRIEATSEPAERRDFLRDQIRQMSNQGVSSWRIAVLLSELGVAQTQLNAHREAERSLLDAWQVFLPMLGAEHPLSKATAGRLIKVYEQLNKVDEAEAWRKRAAGETS